MFCGGSKPLKLKYLQEIEVNILTTNIREAVIDSSCPLFNLFSLTTVAIKYSDKKETFSIKFRYRVSL